MTVTTDTPDTKILEFNFTDKNIHTIEIDGRTFQIKLLEIGDENVPGIEKQLFKYFIFGIEENGTKKT